MTLHSESVLQSLLQPLVCSVEPFLIGREIADAHLSSQLLEKLVVAQRWTDIVAQRREIRHRDRRTTGIRLRRAGEINPIAGARIGVRRLRDAQSDDELS